MSHKKNEIIRLAIGLIKKKGFNSFSYDDISKELNITKAAVHYHFEKKEDLGVAVCEAIQASLKENYKKTLHEIKMHHGNPWNFIENSINMLEAFEICPISSLQSDYEYLPNRVKEKLIQISEYECELLSKLTKEYSPYFSDHAVAITALMSVKASLQYRRILGDSFYETQLKNIKEQFYNMIAN